jgi:sugar phosphate isomerase/epimerase
MHLGAVTYNVLKDWDVETIIKNLEAAGFEAVELRSSHKHGVEPSIDREERTRVRKRFEASHVRLLSYGTACEFHSPDPAERRKNVDLAKQFVDLARDTGAWGVKVRPNGLPKEVPPETTIQNIGACLRELGDYGAARAVEIWMEVHGPETMKPPISAAILKAAGHDNVGACWNSNAADIVGGTVKPSFELLKRWIRSVHITELANPNYPWRELFTLLREAKYDRYTLCETGASKEPERFLRWYKALWTELTRPCG